MDAAVRREQWGRPCRGGSSWRCGGWKCNEGVGDGNAMEVWGTEMHHFTPDGDPLPLHLSETCPPYHLFRPRPLPLRPHAFLPSWAQVMGPDDGYICQFSRNTGSFWADRNDLALGAGLKALGPGARRGSGGGNGGGSNGGGVRVGKMQPSVSWRGGKGGLWGQAIASHILR